MTVETPDYSDESHFIPFARQEEFFGIPTSIKEAFFGGAAGPGKSYALLMDPILRRLHEHPRFHGILFRESFREQEESLVFESQHLYKPLGATYSGKPTFAWKFPSGAIIRFGYLQRDEQVYQHDTAQYNYVAFDELTAFTRFRWMYLVHVRCRTTVPGLPAYARAASNPLGIGHAWVKERFIDPAPGGRKIIAEQMPDGTTVKRIFIPAKVTDNPLIMKENPEYINSLMLLPEAEKRSKLYGDWDAVAGQVFTEFRTMQMPDEPDNAIHVIKPFPIPEYWPVVLAIDWGFDHPMWAGFFAIAPNERFYLCEEFTAKQVKIKVWGADLARRAHRYQNLKTPVSLDRSAWGDRGDELTLAQQIEAAILMPVERADSDRVGGKLLMHEYFRWRPRPARFEPPTGYSKDTEDLIFRRRGEEAARRYVAYFDPEPLELNLPQFQVFDTCTEFIRAVIACVSDPKKPEDVLKFAGDDPYDGGRYGFKRVHRYFDESKDAHKAFVRRDAVVERLHASGDMTSFYQEMEKLEEDERVDTAPVRRYDARTRSGRSFRATH